MVTKKPIAELTTAELRNIIRGQRGVIGPTAAFHELARRRPRGITSTLVSLARDTELSKSIRGMAIAALGDAQTPTGLSVLRDTIGDGGDPDLRRLAIDRLGKSGTADDLDLLASITGGNAALRRTVRAAKLALSYRHELGEYRHDVPSRRSLPGDAAAEPIVFGRLTVKQRSSIERGAVRAPGLRLDLARPTRVRCGDGREYVLAFNPRLDATTFARTQLVGGALLARNPETNVLQPLYRIDADPRSSTSMHLIVVRPSGRTTAYGTATLAGSHLVFDIAATTEPSFHPFVVEGTFDLASYRISVDRAETAAEFSARQQRRRRQPTPLI